MLLGKVIGVVVATKKEAELEGLKLLVVRAADVDGTPKGATIIAVDAVGAGPGEVVLVAAGSSARQTAQTRDRPVDHVVMAIVDAVEADGATRYKKDA